MLQRLLAFVLLVAFSLPLALPALAGQGDEAGLPACCRRDGAHHCAMSMAERTSLVAHQGRRWQAPLERCPYCPSTPAGVHGTTLAAPPAGSQLPMGDRLTASVRAAECLWRVARERARQQRGPPATPFA